MRRKNLMVTAGLVLVLVFLHGMGVPLKTSRLMDSFGEKEKSLEMMGTVTKIKVDDEGKCKLDVKIEKAGGEKIRPREKILLRCEKEELGCEPWEMYRRKISFSAELKVPEEQRNPKCFDYRLYLMSQNIFLEGYADKIAFADGEREGGNVLRFLVKMRFLFIENLNDDAAGLVTGMLFGDTSQLDENVYEQFQSNGTAHVLAVSGLHVGILYSMYKKVFGNRQSVVSVFALIVLLFSYGTLSMWSASMCRASIMIGLNEFARMFDLRYDMTTGLSTVVLIFIFINPYSIFSTGFQMSFLAIASICFLTKILPREVPDGMTAGIAVNIGLMLYQIYQFNYISLVSLFVNIPIIYLTGILVPASLASFVVFIMCGSLPKILHLLLDSLSFFTISLNGASTLGGYGSIDVVSPPLWVVFCGYFLLFFLSSEQNLIFRLRNQTRRQRLVLACGIVCCILLSTLYYCPVSDADLVFVDVGQGDCTHIRDGRKNVLIDGGGSANYNVGKKTLKPYLLKNGVWNVDLALATHTHTDHYKGLEELSEVYPVKEIRQGMTAGDKVLISKSVWIETLWPLVIDPEKGQEENEDCSAFLIHYGKWKIMITGDLDQAGEEAMIKYYESRGEVEKLDSDILKLGHHGSETSTSDRFLSVTSPQVVVIQVGKNNRYGHPSQKIVEKCQKHGTMMVRNDYNGGIGFSFSDKSFRIDTVL